MSQARENPWATWSIPLSIRRWISGCGGIRLFLFEYPCDGLAQTIQDSIVVGTPDIHGDEMLLIEAGRANEFLEELLLGLRSVSANEQVAVRPGRLHRLFQNGAPPGRTTEDGGRCT